MPLLEVENVSVEFPAEPGPIRALDGVSLRIEEGQTVALVGESGSGKSTLARAILGLVRPASGTVRFSGTPLAPLGTPERRALFSELQMIFQDPDASLNPRLTVAASIGEPFDNVAPRVSGADRAARVADLMRDVGLEPTLGGRYPHELSGGQKQRVCIARALSLRPKLVVCDEPVSALDVSIQAQILNLLVELRERLSLSYLFISHDLRVVRHVSSRVSVMYLGQIVESGATDALFGDPQHPYTRALLASVPSLDPAAPVPSNRARGEIPSPSNPPRGCHFHTRCPEVFERCSREAPRLYSISKMGGQSRCFLAEAPKSAE